MERQKVAATWAVLEKERPGPRTAAFTMALYRELAAEPGNLFVSPYSVAMTLAMAHTGAAGKTRQEIETALGLGGAGLIDTFSALAREHTRLGRAIPEADFQTFVANALWCQTGYPIVPGFVGKLRDALGAEVAQADFERHGGEAADRINAWVAGATRGKISQIVSDLDPLTRVLLVNAIYFKSRWAQQFEPEDTKDEPFWLLDGRSVDVPMMHTTAWYDYGRVGSAEALRLAYGNDWFSMIVLVPEEGKLASVEQELDASFLERLRDVLENEEVDLALPRFRVESSFRLRAALEQLGLAATFQPTEADFSGISAEPGFSVSDVLHRTFVNVDEEGTEAAAATAMAFAGAALDPPPPRVFRVDRPFLFLIWIEPTRTVLFMGRVVDPRP
jgi:serpin B